MFAYKFFRAFMFIYVYFGKTRAVVQKHTRVSRKIHHVATLNGSTSTSNAKLQLIIWFLSRASPKKTKRIEQEIIKSAMHSRFWKMIDRRWCRAPQNELRRATTTTAQKKTYMQIFRTGKQARAITKCM